MGCLQGAAVAEPRRGACTSVAPGVPLPAAPHALGPGSLLPHVPPHHPALAPLDLVAHADLSPQQACLLTLPIVSHIRQAMPAHQQAEGDTLSMAPLRAAHLVLATKGD